MKKLKEFTVMVSINLQTDFSIKAESMEEALVKAKEIGVTDVVTFDGDHIDSSLEVTGIYK